jgi:hypothetical protein
LVEKCSCLKNLPVVVGEVITVVGEAVVGTVVTGTGK